jgi:alanine dehydrogenase
MGFTKEEYEKILGSSLQWVKREECFQKDLVLTFKYPYIEKECSTPQTELEYEMKPESILISMIHYPSRPSRVEYLLEKKIHSISLDSITGIDGRTIYDRVGTSQAGVRIGYELIRNISNGFENLDTESLKVVILGGGGVGSQANAELHRYNSKLNSTSEKEIILETVILDKEGANNKSVLSKALKDAHMIIDCAYRSDPRKPIVLKEDLELMRFKVVVDLAGDNYYADNNGEKFVKAVEPVKVLGSLNQMVFVGDYHSQKPLYEKGYKLLQLDKFGILESVCLPSFKYSEENLYVVTCGSWPGTQPGRFFLYEKALKPLVTVLLKKGIEEISNESKDFDEVELSTGILRRPEVLEESEKSYSLKSTDTAVLLLK